MNIQTVNTCFAIFAEQVFFTIILQSRSPERGVFFVKMQLKWNQENVCVEKLHKKCTKMYNSKSLNADKNIQKA